MAVDAKQIELDRMVNMARSFGWSVVKTETIEEKIVITLEKRVAPSPAKS